jgi:glycosyltransferase involved in cell wall biosynthesis
MAPILEAGRPVVGYHGALARWFDYSLLGEVAHLRPDLSFVLVGPDYDNSLKESQLLDHRNVYWLESKPYTEIPSILAYFDIGMIPFRLMDITHATSPLKLFEYMASWKPVVITPMAESMRYEGVLTAGYPEEFSCQLDSALSLRTDRTYLDLLDRIARENTWEIRARQILHLISADNKKPVR